MNTDAPENANARDESDVEEIDGPTGKPSQAEGSDPDQPKGSQAAEPLPAEGHPSPADGGELDA
tara:strand:- start:1630 stop:1821 length:192 start_codon:yes stop_codon:yes gene_type:complete